MKLVSPTEQELVTRVREGDEAAFEQLYSLYKQKLFAYSCKITKSEEVAEEIVHDVFLKVWTYRQRIDSQRSFDAYLFKITKNQILNFLKKAARDKKIQARLLSHFQRVQPRNPTEDQLLLSEYQQMLAAAVAQLSPRRKTIFRMSRIDGMTHAEIATTLNVSAGTVKLQIIQALKSIKEYFRQHSDIVLFFICCFRAFLG